MGKYDEYHFTCHHLVGIVQLLSPYVGGVPFGSEVHHNKLCYHYVAHNQLLCINIREKHYIPPPWCCTRCCVCAHTLNNTHTFTPTHTQTPIITPRTDSQLFIVDSPLLSLLIFQRFHRCLDLTNPHKLLTTRAKEVDPCVAVCRLGVRDVVISHRLDLLRVQSRRLCSFAGFAHILQCGVWRCVDCLHSCRVGGTSLL